MHLLYIPTFLSIQILPEADKQEVRAIFAEFKEWLWTTTDKTTTSGRLTLTVGSVGRQC